MKLIIVDYGTGNLNSIKNVFKKIKIKTNISSKPGDILRADKLILPGVGAFDTAIKKLTATGLKKILVQKVIKHKTPILGICLGMHLFTNKSEEGTLPGLGWINGKTTKFKFNNMPNNLKIPHIGRNNLALKKDCALFKNLNNSAKFYFVHSYHVICENKQDIISKTKYGIDFVSAVQKKNIYGVQFHPEISHKNGLELLKNFARYA